MHINLHLTDDTQLRAHGFVTSSGLFAEIQWDFHGPFPDSRGDGVLWGTPQAMRRLAALATQAAVQAEEEAAWQTRRNTTRPTQRAQVA
jgi:hypothetical protein